jgi:signal transduction histidine kinase
MLGALRWTRARSYPFAWDLLLALLLAGWAVVDALVNLAVAYHVSPLVPNLTVCLLQTLPLAWRRRAPLTVLLIVAAAVALPGWAVVLGLGFVGVSSAAVLSVLVCIYTVAAYADRRAWAIAAVVGAAGPVIFQLQFQPESWMLVGGAALLGSVARRGWQSKERYAAGRERLRIARELHDVVANSVTVITVQAGAARLNFDADPAHAREALASIESKSRQTMAEMRGLLGILRSDSGDGGEQAPLAPQPDLGGLGALIGEVREAGLDVEMTIVGKARPLPPALELSVYRIIQEALTNALKHAGPTTARVLISYGARDIEVEVTNDGPLAEPTILYPQSEGNGLVGMRERAAVFGGSLRAAPRPEGGFRVKVRLPLEQSEL